MDKNEHVLGWHFCDGWKLRDGQELVIGKTYHVHGTLEMCNRGLHLSRRIIDALYYVPGSVICRVEGWGVVEEQDDKLVCHYRKVLVAIDGEEILHRAACHFATDALRVAGVTDKRCWDAIRIKRRWLKGETTDNEWDAAEAAARVAAEAAARAAARAAVRAAAWVAVWDAAWDATRAATRVAAEAAAEAAARAAAMGKQNRYLERVVGLAMGGIR